MKCSTDRTENVRKKYLLQLEKSKAGKVPNDLLGEHYNFEKVPLSKEKREIS